MRNIFFIVGMVFTLASSVAADTVVLKTGEVIQGRIVRETPVFVRIETEDEIGVKEYLNELIDRIEKGSRGDAVPLQVQPSAVEQIPASAVSVPVPADPAAVDREPVVPLNLPAEGKPVQETAAAIEPLKVEQPQTAGPLTNLDNQSIQEFLTAHPPQNLQETPAPVVQEEKSFSVSPREGIIAAVIVALVVVFVVLRKKNTVMKQEVKKKEEAAKEALNLSEDEKKALEHAQNVPKTAIHPQNYWRFVPRIFIYPFKGQVVFATVGGTVFFSIMNVAMYAPFYGLLVMVMFICYMVACMVNIIETAVTVEREDVFDLPDFTTWFDWIGKVFLLAMSVVLCYGPAVAYMYWLKRFDPVFFALIGMGAFISPMYTLSIALVGGFESLNPVNIFKSIGYTFVPYALTLIVLIFTQVLSFLTGLVPLVHIPIWGGLFKWFFVVYFLFVNMRLLGIFYKAHRLRLRWYGEDEND
jgi:hypothetical protein